MLAYIIKIYNQFQINLTYIKFLKNLALIICPIHDPWCHEWDSSLLAVSNHLIVINCLHTFLLKFNHIQQSLNFYLPLKIFRKCNITKSK